MTSTWMAAGSCRQVDPEVFFPGRAESAAPARLVCAACPVLEQCRAYAVADPSLEGVWGGLTVKQRQALRVASPGWRKPCGPRRAAARPTRAPCGCGCRRVLARSTRGEHARLARQAA